MSKSYRGFTLLECLVALVILNLICYFFIPLLGIARSIETDLTDSRQLEWQTFLIQLQNETDHLYLAHVYEQELLFVDPTDESNNISIHFYKHMLRKQKNYQGHQPLLTQIEQVKFVEQKKYCQMDVYFENGQRYQAFFVSQTR